MNEPAHILVLDPDSKRRAQICFAFSKHGIFAEPISEIESLRVGSGQRQAVFVFDEGDAISQTCRATACLDTVVSVVGYAQNPAIHRVVQAVQAGAASYLAWPSSDDALLACLDELSSHERAVWSSHTRRHAAQSRLERLTRREREVLDAVASGLSNRAIGDKLQISPRTVEIHRANMMNKVGAQHTSDAIRLAVEASLTP